MAVGLALLVSADPMTVQQFSHALKEEILPEFVAGKFRKAEYPPYIGKGLSRESESIVRGP